MSTASTHENIDATNSTSSKDLDALHDEVVQRQLLLDVFDLPVSFHRSLIPITGSVTAALLLSHAIWNTQEAEAGSFGAPETDIIDGWFAMSQDQWSRETGLSRWEQETARRSLRQAGLLLERREGVPSRLFFKVDKVAVSQALHRQARTNAARAVDARIAVLEREDHEEVRDGKDGNDGVQPRPRGRERS